MNFEILSDPPTQNAIDDRKRELELDAKKARESIAIAKKQFMAFAVIYFVLGVAGMTALYLMSLDSVQDEFFPVKMFIVFLLIITSFFVIRVIFFEEKISGRSLFKIESDIKNLESISPDEQYDECIKLADWCDRDNDLAEYMRKVIEDGRLPVLAEYIAALGWIKRTEKQRKQSEAWAACERLKQQVSMTS